MFLECFSAVFHFIANIFSLVIFGNKIFEDKTAKNKKLDSYDTNNIVDDCPPTAEWNRNNNINYDATFRQRFTEGFIHNNNLYNNIAQQNLVHAVYNSDNSKKEVVDTPPAALPRPNKHNNQRTMRSNKVNAAGISNKTMGISTSAKNGFSESTVQHRGAPLANTALGDEYTVEPANSIDHSNEVGVNDDRTIVEQDANASQHQYSDELVSNETSAASAAKAVGFVAQSIDTSAQGLKGSTPIVQVDRLSLLTNIAPASSTTSLSLEHEQLKTINGDEKINENFQRHHVTALTFPTIPLKDLSMLNMIGGGGFGQVWLGSWAGTPVAVKMLSNICQNAELPDSLMIAFEEEVGILSHLRHPNICLFLGVCLEPPHRAIVTELVSRGSLWDALRRPVPDLFPDGKAPATINRSDVMMNQYDHQKWLPWPSAVLRRVLEGTVRGLIYLHSHSPPIIHRDLKSANLLLDETFNVKICDFGLARLRDYTTVLTANVGTIQWMAPEVLTGTTYNESADIYSVGIVMWELFTGLCPYEGKSQVEVALSVVQSNVRPNLPSICTSTQANLMKRCWDTDPSSRLTAEQLLVEVHNVFPAT